MGRRSPVCLALVHYPVLNRQGKIIASAVTNLDLHDLGRLARTYDLPACYVVTPLEDQQAMAYRLLSHWETEVARELHPRRGEALARLKIVSAVDAACRDVRDVHGEEPVLWATTARETKGALSFREARRSLAEEPGPRLLLLGTGWGLAPPLLERCGAVLQTIEGIEGYNHLSVRCAAAILVDRLLGRGG